MSMKRYTRTKLHVSVHFVKQQRTNDGKRRKEMENIVRKHMLFNDSLMNCCTELAWDFHFEIDLYWIDRKRCHRHHRRVVHVFAVVPSLIEVLLVSHRLWLRTVHCSYSKTCPGPLHSVRLQILSLKLRPRNSIIVYNISRNANTQRTKHFRAKEVYRILYTINPATRWRWRWRIWCISWANSHPKCRTKRIQHSKRKGRKKEIKKEESVAIPTENLPLAHKTHQANKKTSRQTFFPDIYRPFSFLTWNMFPIWNLLIQCVQLICFPITLFKFQSVGKCFAFMV